MQEAKIHPIDSMGLDEPRNPFPYLLQKLSVISNEAASDWRYSADQSSLLKRWVMQTMSTAFGCLDSI